MKKILIVLLACITISITLNCWFIFNISKQEHVDSEQFYNLVDEVIESFDFEGYREILKKDDHFLAVPLESKGEDLIGRQKMFVYKNDILDTVILLSISSTPKEKLDDMWTGSFNYTEDNFNSLSGKYKEYYNRDYPKVQVACSSFVRKNCNISVVAFANEQDSSVAAEENIKFCNELLKFMER